MSFTVQTNSEIGPIRTVIVHRPDEGISRISPKKSDELLFDDIVHLPTMKKEHDIFTKCLGLFIGKENVLETQHLLREALTTSHYVRQEVIERIIDFEELPKKYEAILMDLDVTSLAKILITGYHEAEDLILFDPIPNFIFTRDIAVTIKDHVIITKAAKTARFRENFLTRCIFWSHPGFSDLRDQNKIINLNNIDHFPPSRKGLPVSMEGGDMMMLSNDHFLIGTSERSNLHSFNCLKSEIFEKGLVNNVVQIAIPPDRSYMHIDTVFTQIDFDTIVCFKPIIYDGLGSNVIIHYKDGSKRSYPSVMEFMLNEISDKMKFIFTGGGESPYQEREQWTDGCNLFAVSPGVAMTYDRNTKTEAEFIKNGYQILHSSDLLEQVSKGELDVKSLEKTIITLPSHELARARGGTHCMTCPIWRENI
jgi:arginine deiminase